LVIVILRIIVFRREERVFKPPVGASVLAFIHRIKLPVLFALNLFFCYGFGFGKKNYK
jgi:hypothetical protein